MEIERRTYPPHSPFPAREGGRGDRSGQSFQPYYRFCSLKLIWKEEESSASYVLLPSRKSPPISHPLTLSLYTFHRPGKSALLRKSISLCEKWSLKCTCLLARSAT